MKFESIYGNEAMKELLLNSIHSHNILHSYLFIGPDGIGKNLFAKEFAKMILCMNETNVANCSSCKSCLEFDSQNHPDFMIISPEDGKSIKIDQIRYLQEKISEKPIISNYKVYIINDSDSMTKEAQNCLLKTLEEPPEYAVLILVLSNESRLLNTIKSRCTKIVFHKLSDDDIKDFFVLQGNEFVLSDSILKVCDGSIGKALQLQKDSSFYQEVDTILSSLETKDIADIWNDSSVLYQAKDSIYHLLEYINVVLMDHLLKTQNAKYIAAIETIETTKNRLASNANYDMSIDTLLLQLWEELNEKHHRC